MCLSWRICVRPGRCSENECAAPRAFRSSSAIPNDAVHLKQALHLGIVDYLVKPFQYERFALAMDKFVLRRKVMESGMEFNQEDIDQLISTARPAAESKEMQLQKGIQRNTLDTVRASLKRHKNVYLTSEKIAEETGLSKVTVRRYMNFLIGQNEIVSRIDYETGGRPRTEYCMNTV